jgi:hypothetical protein
MEGLRGIAEVIDHILYEILGLLIPGTAVLLAISRLFGPETWQAVMFFGENHLWIAVGLAYALGYVVQGLSRPIVGLFAWFLGLPARLLGWPFLHLSRARRRSLRRFGVEARKLGRKAQGWTKEHLLDRHRPRETLVPRWQAVDFLVLAQQRWRIRLGLPDDRILSSKQITNLSFSDLLIERGRLDRFRAATSLCRGLAVAAALSLGLVALQMLLGQRSPSAPNFLLLTGLTVAFYGLLERADFYDRLWESVLQPQFLAHETRERIPSPQERPSC